MISVCCASVYIRFSTVLLMTDTPSRVNKRSRPYSSPDSAEEDGNLGLSVDMTSEKVGDLTQDKLISVLSSLLDNKLANLATKDDLSSLSNKVAAVTEENNILREEVANLKASEKVILGKLLDLEGRSRRNNLIFRGLKWAGKYPNYVEVVRGFCNEVLGASDMVFVNRAHLLGKDGSAIIAHIPNDTDIEYVMRQTKRLKGTGYAVQRDYPKEVRAKRASLMAVRAEVERVAGRRKMPLVFDHLTVNGCRFTWEDGQLRAGQRDGGDALQSMFKHDFRQFLDNPASFTNNQPRPLGRPEESSLLSASQQTREDGGQPSPTPPSVASTV